MKRTFVTLLASLLLALAAVSQTPKPHKHHVVIEMSLATQNGWWEAEGHVRVLRDAFSNNVDIEVVCMGEGLPMLSRSDTELQAALQSDADAGVVFVACRRSMRAKRQKGAGDYYYCVKKVGQASACARLQPGSGTIAPRLQRRAFPTSIQRECRSLSTWTGGLKPAAS